jgi:peptidoglycan/xylan/chitin deacetylase (PgdA/CDA1 family)
VVLYHVAMVGLVIVLVGAVVLLAHSAPFPFLFEAFRPSQSLWRVPSRPGLPPTVYLTFDDGPNATWTPPLLDALRDTGTRATFFLIDEHITPETAPIVRRMADEGHAIALHSGTRRLMVMSPETLAARLTAAAGRIEAIAGREPCRLFRPHAGWRSQAMYAGVSKAGYRLAGWSWGMWDWDWWRRPRADRVARKLAGKASAGDIIVIHDGDHRDPQADRRHASEAVRQLVPILRARGFAFDALCGDSPGP